MTSLLAAHLLPECQCQLAGVWGPEHGLEASWAVRLLSMLSSMKLLGALQRQQSWHANQNLQSDTACAAAAAVPAVTALLTTSRDSSE